MDYGSALNGMDPFADSDTLGLSNRKQPVRLVICLAETPENRMRWTIHLKRVKAEMDEECDHTQ